jgi:hypothetical protein
MLRLVSPPKTRVLLRSYPPDALPCAAQYLARLGWCSNRKCTTSSDPSPMIAITCRQRAARYVMLHAWATLAVIRYVREVLVLGFEICELNGKWMVGRACLEDNDVGARQAGESAAENLLEAVGHDAGNGLNAA